MAEQFQKLRYPCSLFCKNGASGFQSASQQWRSSFRNCVACEVSSRSLAQEASKARHNNGGAISETALPVKVLLEQWRIGLPKHDTTMAEQFQKLR